MTIQTTRRGFLKSTGGAATGFLLVGLTPDGAIAAASGNSKMLNPFVKIGTDNTVTAIVKHFEKGQGTATGLSSLIAEELSVTMESIEVEFAPSDPSKYNNLLFGQFQGTGGSTAMANSYMQYRQAGAAARDMLIRAAAADWGVDAASLSISDGMISGNGRSASLGDCVQSAAKLTPPTEVQLKDSSQFTIIGNPATRRKDSPEKINGTAQYAMDMQLEGQMVVTIKRTPRMGGLAVSFDDSAAQEVKGYLRAAILPNKAGVAVYATDTWAAFQARDALTAEWDFSAAEGRSSDDIKAELMAGLEGEAEFHATESKAADVSALVNGAETVVEKTFYFPLLAHAPMEPLTCTIEPTAEGGIILHDGCQFPTGPHGALAQILGLKVEQVSINTMLAGGSFGRRANSDADYQVEAGLAFAMTGRSKPVKLVWSREDDITGGYYRPAFAHKVRIGLDNAGKILAWDHRIAGQSIAKGTFFESFSVHNGIDHASVEGVADTDYAIDNMYVGLTDVKPATKVLWWRSVGHSHTAFVMETMMDEAAKAAGRDPVEFRLAHLSGDDPHQQRLAGVLKLATEKAGWGNAEEGRSQGVAVHKSFGTYAAQVAEISRDEAGSVKIEKVTCAVDCGVAVNPDVIKAQMEGGIGYGLGHAMRDQVTLVDGAPEQLNFPDYEPLRMRDIAAIETHIIASDQAPTGVGEPGVPPSAPALANAIAQDGPRVTSLPMSENGVEFN